jgi:hypothetical protein
MDDGGPSAEDSTVQVTDGSDAPRGRKRTRTQVLIFTMIE